MNKVWLVYNKQLHFFPHMLIEILQSRSSSSIGKDSHRNPMTKTTLSSITLILNTMRIIIQWFFKHSLLQPTSLAQYPILVWLHLDYSEHTSFLLGLSFKALPTKNKNHPINIHTTRRERERERESGPEIGGNYSGGGARGGDGNYNCRNPRFEDGEKLRKRLG